MPNPYQIFLILSLLIASCATKEVEESQKDLPVEVFDMQKKRVEKLQEIGHEGWVIYNDCDAALWSYKAQSVICDKDFSDRGSELSDYPGLFSRSPTRICYDRKEKKDVGSKTTWSGDMGLGLTLYSIGCGKKDLLLDHFNAVRANDWISGFGETDAVASRAFYRPSIRASILTALNGLGEKYNALQDADTFLPGQRDYEAHLQLLKIEIHMRSKGELKEFMFKRVKEQFNRVPTDPYFAAMYAVTSGDWAKAIELCSKETLETYNDYVRCAEKDKCELAHMIHACGLLIDYAGNADASLSIR